MNNNYSTQTIDKLKKFLENKLSDEDMLGEHSVEPIKCKECDGFGRVYN